MIINLNMNPLLYSNNAFKRKRSEDMKKGNNLDYIG